MKWDFVLNNIWHNNMKTQKINKEIKRNILLNPGPATTSATVKSSMLVSDICPREEEFGNLFLKISQDLLRVVNGNLSHEAVLVGSSGTGAVESALTSCSSGKKKILILDNGAYGDRMAKICDVYGIGHESLKFTWGDPVEMVIVEKFLKERHNDFEVMAFVHHETTSGVLNPITELCSLAKSYQISTLVDAMSSYAGVEIDLSKTQVDYLISSSNKCIQAMAGLGIIIVSKNELSRIENFKSKSHYFDLVRNFKNQRDNKQFLFTPPVQIVYSLEQALKEYFQEGDNGRINRYANLYEHMLKGMNELGFKYLVPENMHSKILTAFVEPDHPQYSFDSMHNYLYERGVTIYPGKGAKKETFRISNIGELELDDIKDFLRIMNDYLVENKISPLYKS